MNTRAEYNGDDQDFLHDFLKHFPYGTVFSSMDYALSQLNMFGCMYRFKVRKDSTTFRCCKQLSCRFRVNFVHIFRVEAKRLGSGEKYLKGLDNHPIMITRAKLNHDHHL